jgi:hypothetical protein
MTALLIMITGVKTRRNVGKPLLGLVSHLALTLIPGFSPQDASLNGANNQHSPPPGR